MLINILIYRIVAHIMMSLFSFSQRKPNKLPSHACHSETAGVLSKFSAVGHPLWKHLFDMEKAANTHVSPIPSNGSKDPGLSDGIIINT